jgi:hypothetical protein
MMKFPTQISTGVTLAGTTQLVQFRDDEARRRPEIFSLNKNLEETGEN